MNLVFDPPFVGEGLGDWVQIQLPKRNGQVLSGEVTLPALTCELNTVFQMLPDPTTLFLDDCKRQLVLLGLIGSSVERHSQQAGKFAGQALRGLTTPFGSFSRYLATLAARAGGPPRDSFRSYVLWNVPAVSIHLPGEPMPCFVLPSLFPDRFTPFTFSDHTSEKHVLYVLKRCAALEAAANCALSHVILCDLPLHLPKTVHQIETAALLLCAAREEMLAFMQCPEFNTPFFLDTLRPYACPWDVAETYNPPNAAHDHSLVIRDYLLGTPMEGHDKHEAELFPMLDQAAQEELDTARDVLGLPKRLAWQLGVESLDELDTLSSGELDRLIKACPWIGAYYRLYQANADLSAAHRSLRTLERFMHSRTPNPLQALKAFLPAQTSAISPKQLLTIARN